MSKTCGEREEGRKTWWRVILAISGSAAAFSASSLPAFVEYGSLCHTREEDGVPQARTREEKVARSIRKGREQKTIAKLSTKWLNQMAKHDEKYSHLFYPK
jgi:hypothetical protein